MSAPKIALMSGPNFLPLELVVRVSVLVKSLHLNELVSL
jgi:hypothetical protein